MTHRLLKSALALTMLSAAPASASAGVRDALLDQDALLYPQKVDGGDLSGLKLSAGEAASYESKLHLAAHSSPIGFDQARSAVIEPVEPFRTSRDLRAAEIQHQRAQAGLRRVSGFGDRELIGEWRREAKRAHKSLKRARRLSV